MRFPLFSTSYGPRIVGGDNQGDRPRLFCVTDPETVACPNFVPEPPILGSRKRLPNNCEQLYGWALRAAMYEFHQAADGETKLMQLTLS